jgi:hypothetical protein
MWFFHPAPRAALRHRVRPLTFEGSTPHISDRRPYPAGAAICGGGRLDQVADRFGAARRPLVGRAGEIDAITRLLQDAAGGRGGELLVSGEAGVGNTALVREASARVGECSDVLWAPCLPLTSLAVPFLPLTSALRDGPRSVQGPATAACSTARCAGPGYPRPRHTKPPTRTPG